MARTSDHHAARSRVAAPLAIVAIVATAAAPGQVTFVDRAVELGLTQSAFGIGLAFGDWDGDGDYDVYVQNSGDASAAFRNDLPAGFTDVTAALGIGHPGQGWSVAFADFDEDDDLDFYLGNREDNFLWRNTGNGTFEDATAGLGVTEPAFSQGVCWVDFDMDGDLDLHITEEFVPFRMMRQRPDGLFEDVSAETGLNDLQSHGYGLSWADFDGDGDLDCAIANCGFSEIPPNDVVIGRLFRNNLRGTGSLRFSEIGAEAGVDYQGNMYGCEFGDPDNDGDWDLFVASAFSDKNNRFYRNDGTLPFVESAVPVGLATPVAAHHGVEWVDYDNDGDLDLYIQNGGGRDRLFHNSLVETGTMTFTERGQAAGFASVGGGFDGAWADVDGDGDLDLYSVKNGVDQLYFNQGGNANSHLFVSLRGSRDTLSGLGATIVVRAGGQTMMRLHGGHVGSFSQSALPSHFGLGKAAMVDEVVVRWVTGGETVVPGPIAPNQPLTIGQAAAPPSSGLVIP